MTMASWFRWPRLGRFEGLGLLCFVLTLAGQLIFGMLARTGSEPTTQVERKHHLGQRQQIEGRIEHVFTQGPSWPMRSDGKTHLMRKVLWIHTGLFLLGIASFFCFLRAFWRWVRRKPVHPHIGFLAMPSWGLREIVGVVFWSLALTQLAILIREGIFGILHAPSMDRHLAIFFNTIILDLCLLLVSLWVMKRGKATSVRFSVSEILRRIRFALVEYLTYLPVLVSLMIVTVAILQSLLNQPPKPQEVMTIYLSEERQGALILLTFLIAVMGPIAEEVFFRGLVYRWIRFRFGLWRALGISAGLFAFLHGDWVFFVPIFGLGWIFGWIYERTGSLVAPMSVHILHNTGMLVLASLIKDLIRV